MAVEEQERKAKTQPEEQHTSAIIMWQSNVPRPWFVVGWSTCLRILATTGAPKVMLGTKWPSLHHRSQYAFLLLSFN